MSQTQQRITDPAWRQEVEHATDLLQERNPHRREEAIRQLQKLSATPHELLDLALNDRNSYVRQAAVQALGSARGAITEDAIDVLISAIHDGNDHVSAAAIEQLGRFGDNQGIADEELARQCVEEIASLLEGSAPARLQTEAVKALGLLGAKQFVDQIVPFLESPLRRLKIAAIRTLGRFESQQSAPKVLKILEEEAKREGEPDYDLCRACVRAIEQTAYQPATPFLVHVAGNQVGLRRMAVKTLIHLNPQAAAPVLLDMLRDPSPDLRSNLAMLMCRADYLPALPAVRELLDDSVVEVRRAALRALTQWNDAGAVDKVQHMAQHDPNSLIRPLAVRCLVDLIGAEQARPALFELRNDTNSRVREVVARILNPEETASCVEGDEPNEPSRVLETTITPSPNGEGSSKVRDHQTDLQSVNRYSAKTALRSTILPQAFQIQRSLQDWRKWFRDFDPNASGGIHQHVEAMESELMSLIEQLQNSDETSPPIDEPLKTTPSKSVNPPSSQNVPTN